MTSDRVCEDRLRLAAQAAGFALTMDGGLNEVVVERPRKQTLLRRVATVARRNFKLAA